MDKDTAKQILDRIQEAQDDPTRVIQIIEEIGESLGINVFEIYSKIIAERNPKESLETTFQRIMEESRNKPKI